jgi:hypothetical protein
MRRSVLCLLGLLAICGAAFAGDGDAAPTGVQDLKANSLFVFGGLFTTGYLGQSIVPLTGGIEGSVIAGAAYQRHLHETRRGFRFGAELGLAGRFGALSSAEAWMGFTLGHRGIRIKSLTISPQIVGGFSVVTGPSGMEPFRIATEAGGVGDPTLLFYLGPELSFRTARRPDIEFVYRVHHRSGGGHTLGNMRGGSNVQVFGIRRRF